VISADSSSHNEIRFYEAPGPGFGWAQVLCRFLGSDQRENTCSLDTTPIMRGRAGIDDRALATEPGERSESAHLFEKLGDEWIR